MLNHLYFDLDGTLCESKQECPPDIVSELKRLQASHSVFIISGASMEQMRLQVPLEVNLMAQNGNERYIGGETTNSTQKLDKDAVYHHISHLSKEMDIDVTPEMIEDRGHQISFSFTGHNAPWPRKKNFDPFREIRENLLKKYPFDNAVIGGTTCIDYIPRNKGENISDYITEHAINVMDCMYFGDALKGNGNDGTVLGVIPTMQVRDWEHTCAILKTL